MTGTTRPSPVAPPPVALPPVAPAAPSAVPASWRAAGWLLPPLVVWAVLFCYPLGVIVREALGGPGQAPSLQPFIDVLGSRAFLHGLGRTIAIALGASAGCVALGFVLSLILAFLPFRGSRLIGGLIDAFIALPTFLVVLAFTFLYGSAGLLNAVSMRVLRQDLPPFDFLYSPWGVVLAEITVYTPFVMRLLLASLVRIDPAQLEAASSLGARPARIVRQIILPAALPTLLASGSLCLLLTVNEFGVGLFIGAKDVVTLPLMIHGKALQEFDHTAACVIAVANIALSLALFTAYRTMLAWWGDRHASVG